MKKMIKFGKGVVKCRFRDFNPGFFTADSIRDRLYEKPELIIDILSYLPGQIETMKGQDILLDEFGNRRVLFCSC